MLDDLPSKGERYTCSDDGSKLFVDSMRLAGGFDFDIDCTITHPDGRVEKVLHFADSWTRLNLQKVEL